MKNKLLPFSLIVACCLLSFIKSGVAADAPAIVDAPAKPETKTSDAHSEPADAPTKPADSPSKPAHAPSTPTDIPAQPVSPVVPAKPSLPPGHSPTSEPGQNSVPNKSSTLPLKPSPTPSTPLPSADADPIMRALVDEMNRTMKQLQPSHGMKPFYLSFTVNQTEEVEYVGSLGSLTKVVPPITGRSLTTDLRLGSYDVDSKFGNQSVIRVTGKALTADNDYGSIRRAAWLACDDAYSTAVKGLEAKNTWLKTHKIKDRLPDFSREPSVQDIQPVLTLQVDQKDWQDKVRRLSSIYKKYPRLEMTVVMFTARVRTRWFVNSEGARIVESVPESFVFTGAESAPDGGIKHWDCDARFASKSAGLPSDADLDAWINTFAQNVVDFSNAPVCEEYSGPILFEGQAGATFFSNLLGGNLGSWDFRSGDNGDQSELAWNVLRNAVGRRILPKYISVTDDPFLTSAEGKELTGGWKIDGDGIPAQKLTLVDHGVLKAFCTSRVPIRNQPHSNGHSVLGVGTNSILIVDSSKTLTREELRKKLFEIGEEDGLDYVLVARSLYSPYLIGACPSPLDPEKIFDENFTQGYIAGPIQLFKVYIKDGHEEKIQGANIKSYDLRRILKDIQAVGDDAHPYLVERYDLHKPTHIIAPSVLIREIDIDRDPRSNEAARVIPSPLATKDAAN